MHQRDVSWWKRELNHGIEGGVGEGTPGLSSKQPVGLGQGPGAAGEGHSSLAGQWG